MTPEEAIAELIDSLDESIPSVRERRREATSLGIESLKRERSWRISPDCTYIVPLPGETEE